MYIRSGRAEFVREYATTWGFPYSSAGEEPSCNAGDPSLIPGMGRSPGEGIGYPLQYTWASLVAQMVKNLPALSKTWALSLGWKIPWRRSWQLTPVFLPGEFPWTEEPGGFQSMESQRVGHDWLTKHSTARATSTTKVHPFFCKSPV